jgi:hypothetical protein
MPMSSRRESRLFKTCSRTSPSKRSRRLGNFLGGFFQTRALQRDPAMALFYSRTHKGGTVSVGHDPIGAYRRRNCGPQGPNRSSYFRNLCPHSVTLSPHQLLRPIAPAIMVKPREARAVLGRSQAVRQRILIPPCGGLIFPGWREPPISPRVRPMRLSLWPAISGISVLWGRV